MKAPSLALRALLLVTVTASPAAAQRVTTESNEALHRWVRAVNAHTPGDSDAAVQYVVGLTYSERRELNLAYALFIRVLREELVETRSPVEQNVTAFARSIRADPGTAAYLKRAAVLHMDSLIFTRRFARPPDDAPEPPPQTRRRDAPDALTPRTSRPSEEPPPLLHNEWITLSRDGQVIGNEKADWNLPFARSLLGVLLLASTARPTAVDCPVSVGVKCAPVTTVDRVVQSSDRAFVAEWYHAVSAYLFSTGKYGDSARHLRDAARVLPDDPHALFDRGTHAETFGLPIYQVVLEDPAYNQRNGIVVGIPPEAKTNAEAEQMFRRALVVDSSYTEARVRLARLLERRGQLEEAATQVAAAIDADPDEDVLGFYTYLVAGRIASARGRYEEALEHYRAASAIVARAQSALLGASHAALMLADVPETLSPLEQLEDGGTGATADDPWWDYQLGAGRDAAALLSAIRASVPK